MDQVSFRSRRPDDQRAFSGVISQAPLASEKRAKRDGNLPVPAALVSRRECQRVVQCIAREFDKFFDAVETLDERFDESHGIGCALCSAKAS
jgi:hypothetical protein